MLQAEWHVFYIIKLITNGKLCLYLVDFSNVIYFQKANFYFQWNKNDNTDKQN